MLRHARILVAEDDADLLSTVTQVLERLGAEVVKATSGGELIERLSDEGPFDLVITDISMPWMTGLQATHSVRTAGVSTPILVITGLKDERIPEQVLALGNNAILLRKPFGVDELESAVESLLEPEETSGDTR